MPNQFFTDPLGLGPKPKAPPLTPEEQQSILSRLASQAMPVMSVIGDVLDTPGAFVRTALAGQNPFAGVFDPSKRASGRDMLTAWGVTNENDPDAWELADFAGFGAELATDPLMFLNMGTGAVTRAGGVAKAAGILPAGAAGRSGSTLRGLAGDLMSQAGKTDEIGSVLAGERMKALQDAAEAAGYGKSGNPIADLLASPMADEKLGGAWGLGIPGMGNAIVGDKIPFAGMAKSAITAPWELAKKVPIAGPMLQGAEDATLGAISAVGRTGNQIFDRSVRDTFTAPGQAAAREVTAMQRASGIRWRERIAEMAQQRRDAGLTDDAHSDELWRLVEGVQATPSNPLLGAQAAEISAKYKEALAQKQRYGIKISDLDDMHSYAFRQLYEGTDSDGIAKAFNTRDPSTIQRVEPLRGLPGGTASIREMARAVEGAGLAGDEAGIKALITSTFGAMVPSGKEDGIAGFLAGLSDEQLKRGAFSGDPSVLFGKYMEHNDDVVSSIDKTLDLMKGYAQPTGSGGVSITSILNKAGLASTSPGGGALEMLAKKMGVPYDPKLGKMEVPKEIANDLATLIKSHTSPEPIGKVLKFIDSFTSVWKAGVLTTPSRYTRDFSSGVFNNFIAGEFSPAMYNIANKLLKVPGEVKGIAKQFPKLGKTDAEVTEALRRKVYAQDLIGHYKGRDVLGSENRHREHSISEVLTGLTGTRPYSHRDTANKLFGKHPDVTWKNPTAVRGFGDNEVSRFAPVAAGDDLSYYTDSINRLAGWLKQVKRGVSESAAAEKMRAVQVDYSSKALTRTESQLFTRLFPFYRFTKGMLPWSLKQLYEKPGGAMAQTIKGASRARDRDEIMPERITNSLNIPWGTSEDGTKRFLTNFGLAYEDPLQLFTVGRDGYESAGGTLQDILARTNPLIRSAIELGTGELMFGGGQDIRDADPQLGRTISNISETFGGNPTDTKQFGLLPEYLLSATPYAGAWLNKIRTAFDPRKEGLEGGVAKVSNLLTGLRLTDVSPEAQNRVVNDLIRESIRDEGGTVFQTPYLPESRRAVLGEEGSRPIEEMIQLDRHRQRELRRERALSQ